MSNINIYAGKKNFRMKEEKLNLNKIDRETKVVVLFGSENDDCDMEHLESLKQEILKQYPDTSLKNMLVWHIEPYESIKNAGKTMIAVCIPALDFFSLRKEGKILEL